MLREISSVLLGPLKVFMFVSVHDLYVCVRIALMRVHACIHACMHASRHVYVNGEAQLLHAHTHARSTLTIKQAPVCLALGWASSCAKEKGASVRHKEESRTECDAC